MEDGVLVLESPLAAITRIQARFAQAVQPGESLVEELIKERRKEALRELEEK
jgi:hypothetical protein